MYWMFRPFRRYATFSGRAPRIEYWSFVLLTAMVSGFVLIALYGSAMAGLDLFWARHETLLLTCFLLLGAFNLFAVIPGLAVTVRRLHDTDRSGWTLLLALIPLVGAVLLIYYYASPGTDGENRFGPDPLEG